VGDGLFSGGASFIDREEVKLLVWLDNDDAAIAGPAVRNLKWVAGTIRSLANQWVPHDPQTAEPMPTPGEDDDWLDCTVKDVAVVIFKEHDVVVDRNEVFPDSGLASHYIQVSGRRRHETEWVVASLRQLADSLEAESCGGHG